MNLVSEIRQKFSYLHSTDNGSYRLSELDSNTPTWVLRIDGEYAVGIEIDENMKVNEAFSNVSYYTHEFLIEKEDRKSTRLNSSHVAISYAVFCLKKIRSADSKYDMQT